MFYNHLSKPSVYTLSTHLQPPFYTLTLNKVDEDNCIDDGVGLKEKPFDSEMRPKALGVWEN